MRSKEMVSFAHDDRDGSVEIVIETSHNDEQGILILPTSSMKLLCNIFTHD